MSSPPREKPASSGRMMFIPDEPVTINVGPHRVNVYKRVTPEMSAEEKNFAYYMTRNALSVLGLSPDQHLDTLGNQLGCSTIVDGLKTDFIMHHDDHVFDMT